MLIGYARVSTPDQDLAPQCLELRAAGCDRVFTDVASGARAERPGLLEALDYVRAGDTLAAVRLDRIGRSLPHLLELAGDLERRDVGLRLLAQGIDTTTAGGRMVFAMLGAIAEFERELIVERTQAGLAAARAQGRHGGRPRVMTPGKLRAARQAVADGATMAEAASTVGVSRRTLYRAMGENDG